MRSPRVILGLLLLATVGCALHEHKMAVRPAANAIPDETDPQRYFNPPFQLAVPEDAIVRIVGPVTTCSGTLIDEDLVLTAHHCVVKLTADEHYTRTTLPPSQMQVELGGDYLPWGTVAVREIVTPPCGESGGAGDLAVLVLDHKLIGIVPYTVRLDQAPLRGQTVDPAGFGRCALSADGIHREVRAGGRIRALTKDTIGVVASVCPGDSGGPVFLRGSHEIVGVVSLSAMDGDEHTRSPSIMARVDAFRSLFAEARLIADGQNKAELPPLSCNR